MRWIARLFRRRPQAPRLAVVVVMTGQWARVRTIVVAQKGKR